MQIEARRRQKLCWTTSENKIHIRRVWQVMSGIIAEEEAALFCFLWPACRLVSPTSFLPSRRFGVLRQTSWGPAEDRGGAEGAFLKGIITVRAEDVRDHSVNRVGVVREEGAFPFSHSSPSSSSLDCGAVRFCWVERKETPMEDSFKDALLPVWGGVGSLFSQGQSPTLSVLSNALGALWLPDAVAVWSGVLWRQRRVIASWPGGKNRRQNQLDEANTKKRKEKCNTSPPESNRNRDNWNRINKNLQIENAAVVNEGETLLVTVGLVLGRLLWTGASQYPFPRLGVLRFALGQWLDLWRRSVLTQGGPQWAVARGPL